MTSSRRAQVCLAAATFSMASLARAGVWGAEPTIGLSADYLSNAALLAVPNTAEHHLALTLDAPTTYVGDAFKLSILPSFRLSDNGGYSTVDSDYENFGVSGEYDTERGTLSASASVLRDSSLYHDYLANGATGVRRDTGSADMNWTLHWTERLDFAADLNGQRVRYGAAQGIASLTDYKYVSASPSLTWKQSERNRLTVSASAGRYDSLGGETASRNVNLQVGAVRDIGELWALSATVGYSHARNSAELYYPVLVLTPSGLQIVYVGQAYASSQNGSVYAVSLSHQAQLLQFKAQASRQLTPSGFAYLSRQDDYEVSASYPRSERWTFSGLARRVKYAYPSTAGATYDITYTYASMTAEWRWTEKWTLSASALRVFERTGLARTAVSTNDFNLALTRRFQWRKFQ